MRKALIAIAILALAVSVAYAAEGDTTKANEPVGAVVEATGTFVGSVVNVVTGGVANTGKASVTVVDETGKTMVFPVDQTVKIVDATMNVITLGQLKSGEKVSVSYEKEGGATKAEEIKVQK